MPRLLADIVPGNQLITFWNRSEQKKKKKLKVYIGRVGLIRLFYRAMHFSAKRGIAIACRLSVIRLSVCL